jgi:lysophospholipase L1-like esterase
MTNSTRTKVGSEERFNGPDIHPTPAGYKELANEILKEEAKRCHTQGYPGF